MKLKSLANLLMAVLVLSACTKDKSTGEKTLNLVVTAKVKGFDPIQTSDRYSHTEVNRVYEGLLEFHYLKRPYQLQPNLAAAMPEVSKDGLTYTFKILKGVMFQDDACFPQGKGRELKASDFVYSIKRLADPKLQATGWWLLQDKLKGLDAWREKQSKASETNYDEKVEGLQAVDDYTIKFVLNKPYPQFLYALAMGFTFAVPREAVEKYGKEFLNHPVGTGPFKTEKFTQGNKIVYEKNPTFRDKFYPSEGMPEDKQNGLLEDAGKKLPLVDKIVVNIQTESQPRWLNFQKGKLDIVPIPKDNFDQAITPDKKLVGSMSEKGMIFNTLIDMDVTYTAVNMEDPLFKNNLDLIHAMSMALDRSKINELFYMNSAEPAQGPIPPGIAGYDKNYKNPYTEFNPEKAKELLKKAGYPNGKGLPAITLEHLANTTSRQIAQYFQKALGDIGIKVNLSSNTWPKFTEKQNNKQAQVFGLAWGADYPDAENFLQLFYGPNESPGSNSSNYKNKEFDKLFEKAKIMQDSPERTQIYEKLNKMIAEKGPWIMGVHRTKFVLSQGWLKNYKISAFDHGIEKYWDIDTVKKDKLKDKM